MKYKAILFDMNGVLVDDEHLQEEAFRQTLLRLDVPLSPEDYTRFFIGKTDHKGFEDYFHFLGITENIDPLITWKSEEYQQLASRGIKGYPGVQEFIEAVTEQGFKLAVVTSSTKSEAISVLAGLGLVQYFQSIIAADDVKNGKPDPEGYLKGATALSVSPHECIVVEDAPSGLTAAKLAGMFSVVVLNTHGLGELFEIDIIVERLSASLVDDLLKVE